LQGGPPPDQTMDLDDLARLHREWSSHAAEGLLTLGMASRSISASPRGAATMDVIRRDWAGARALGLPITIHTGGAGTIATLDREKLLGPDVQLVHPGAWDAADLATVVRSGVRVSMSPLSEMRTSLPPLVELLKLGVKPSLSMDSASVIGTNNMFTAMSVTMTGQLFRAKDPLAVSARQILEMATINGAWDLGIADKVGSLTPGKRADLIMVRTDDINIAPLGDPVTAIVRSAQAANVDTVVVDGRILKRGGRLTALDTGAIVRDATDSLSGLKQRAGWR
jgi:cytosine/adenosine deaminase-related metal-dependent hydrolase